MTDIKSLIQLNDQKVKEKEEAQRKTQEENQKAYKKARDQVIQSTVVLIEPIIKKYVADNLQAGNFKESDFKPNINNEIYDYKKSRELSCDDLIPIVRQSLNKCIEQEKNNENNENKENKEKSIQLQQQLRADISSAEPIRMVCEKLNRELKSQNLMIFFVRHEEWNYFYLVEFQSAKRCSIM